jgi:peptidoglycan/LPS O-acetylase OafA/YrhL
VPRQEIEMDGGGDRPATRAVEYDVLIASCAISAGIHAALTPGHLREETPAGVGFIVSAVLLAALCVALTCRPGSRLVVGATGALLAGLIVVYALAVTVGAPVLHPGAEPADRLGLVTKAIELVGLTAALHLTAPGRPGGRLTRLQPKGTTR